MAATSPIKSQGSKVYLSNENADLTVYGSATFAQVGQVHNIGAPSGEANDIETTHLDSTAKEYLIGLPDNGSIEIGMNALSGDAGHSVAIAALNDQNRRWLKVIWSNGNVWSITVLIKKYTWSAGIDNKVDAAMNMRTSGPWTRA